MPQVETLAAGVLFAQTEGIIPAPESTHAIAAAIREAQKAREEGTPRTILFNLSGTGVIDLYAYEQYLAGVLKDYTPSDEGQPVGEADLKHRLKQWKGRAAGWGPLLRFFSKNPVFEPFRAKLFGPIEKNPYL